MENDTNHHCRLFNLVLMANWIDNDDDDDDALNVCRCLSSNLLLGTSHHIDIITIDIFFHIYLGTIVYICMYYNWFSTLNINSELLLFDFLTNSLSTEMYFLFEACKHRLRYHYYCYCVLLRFIAFYYSISSITSCEMFLNLLSLLLLLL